MHKRSRMVLSSAMLIWTTVVAVGFAAAQGRGRGAGASPASQPPPQTVTPQSYPPEAIEAGQRLFAAQCGFCHGRDAAGGEGGADLTRSTLVAGDVRGDRIGPVVRNGRVERGMPAFPLAEPDLAAVVAFIHHQQTTAQAQRGGRRSVDEADLQTGDADAGRRYFEAACTRCHSATGDLAGVARRFQGLTLLQRMLYPPAAGGAVAPAKVTVTLPSGETISGTLAYRDEFIVAVRDADGWHRSWPAGQVKHRIEDPLEGHVEQLGKYTDADMHNVLAYLQTLR